MSPPEQQHYTEEEQEKLLDDARKNVKAQAFYMKRCLDQGKLMDGLKHASNMICELRTGLLSPRKYYDLYMSVCDQLRYLESFLLEENRKGRRMSELYEVVQYAGNVLPRMYLIITVGSVYIQSAEAATKDVLKDLVEMSRGVQHPMRGLFLRNYLSSVAKDKLPDSESASEANGEVSDSIDFVLSNFVETNRLWVRLQHQGPVRDREKREKERLELRILVGTNLVRLSQLDGVTAAVYKDEVLPRVLEQVINCKDAIAQQYLMEVLVQVFSDDLHLSTLEQLLEACASLHANVNIKDILVSLVDRVASYAQEYPAQVPEDLQILDIFSSHISEIIAARPKMELAEVLSLQAALLNLATKVYPDRLSYIDKVFGNAAATLKSLEVTKVEKPSCVKQMVELITLPVNAYDNIVTILDLENFAPLMEYLDYATRKRVSVTVVERVLRSSRDAVGLSDADKVNKILDFVSALVVDQDDQPSDANSDEEDFAEEQGLVARLVHFFHADDTDKCFQIFIAARKHFGRGGTKRIQYTLVPLLFAALDLAPRVMAREKDGNPGVVPSKKVFGFAHEIVTALAPHYPELALRLFLQTGLAADAGGFEAISYEFFTQAFVIYEDDISDSKRQFEAIKLVQGTLASTKNLGEDNYETLAAKACQYASKLLKKPMQAIAVCLCAHLFWTGSDEAPGYRNAKRVLECLQKALKLADACIDPTSEVQLFVEILNSYVYFFEAQVDTVLPKYLTGLISLINTKMASLEGTSDEVTAINVHYKNTIAHIEVRKKRDDGARYGDIETA